MKKFTLLAFVMISCFMASAQTVFINEIHYDNFGTDSLEGVEIAGPSGTDLSNYEIYLYNGNNGASYQTISLSGTIPNQACNMGVLWFLIPNIQNGAPDGIALVENSTNVIQFLSYEGSFTATAGPANGMTSIDIGVSEPGTLGNSLQLAGNGTNASNFVWTSDTTNTNGAMNLQQDFCGTATTTVAFENSNYSFNEADGTVTIMAKISPAASSTGFVNILITDVTATENADYSITGATSSMLNTTVNSGDTAIVVTIVLTDDANMESNEKFTLSIDSTSFLIGTIQSADITIADNDFNVSPTPSTVFINELHYDNYGSDTLEGFEIFAPANTDLSNYAIMLYNGFDGTPYDSIPLSGIMPDIHCGYGTKWFDRSNIQNGASNEGDGMALVMGNTLLQFISYENAFLGQTGPAAGFMADLLPVSEPSPVGHSLQLEGLVSFPGYILFNWISDTLSRDTFNVQQLICVLGVSNTLNSEVKIYPTLTQNFIYIENVKTGVVFVNDLLGKEILKVEISNENNQKIDLSKLNKGIYFVSYIDVSNKKTIAKIIKN